LAAASDALAERALVLLGADLDRGIVRGSVNFLATRIFDTVIAGRLLGIRAFSLAALVEQYFGVSLTKGSQKANWAKRPLPKHMAEYAMNDTHYLLPLAEKLEEELKAKGRLEWFHQSCDRSLAQIAIDRV